VQNTITVIRVLPPRRGARAHHPDPAGKMTLTRRFVSGAGLG
jgi:hypothetical protein